MVPVKIGLFRPYYKQKIRPVMKKVYLIVMMLLFCFGSHAARATNISEQYLQGVGNAWASVLGGVGPGAQIARYINEASTDNRAAYENFVRIIGFNDTALTIYETTTHLDRAFSVTDKPMTARRTACVFDVPGCATMRRTLELDAEGFATYADYDSDANGDFTTGGMGISVRARGFVTDGAAFGIEYTHSKTDTRHDIVDTDAAGNSITMFAQYLSRAGLFVNVGLNGGHISWKDDKTIAGVANNDAHETDFYAGQITTGVQMTHSRIAITPHISARYSYMKTDRHIDPAAQEFDKWWHNTLSVSGGVRAGFDFFVSDFLVRPTISGGAGYDIISHGTDDVSVRVLSGQTYDIPTERPARTALNAGAGIGVYGAAFAATLDYRMDARSDYMAHTGMLNLKIAF